MPEWHAKIRGGYNQTSLEAQENAQMVWGILYSESYTVEAAAGVCGNISAESAFNPWRWQSDVVNYKRGYGLFQFDDAQAYFDYCTDLPGFSPSRSTTSETPGATPLDGQAQIYAFTTNRLGKWVSSCWRSYWSASRYPSEYALRRRILNTWGNGSRLTMAQFATIDDITCATFAFLACFEGSKEIHLQNRINRANYYYEVISGSPPPPPGPGPGPWGYGRRFPFYLLRRYRYK